MAYMRGGAGVKTGSAQGVLDKKGTRCRRQRHPSQKYGMLWRVKGLGGDVRDATWTEGRQLNGNFHPEEKCNKKAT